MEDQEQQTYPAELTKYHSTAEYLSFGPMAQCVVHALKGMACRAHVTPASFPASHCKQCSALTSPSLHACGCASTSRAHCREVTKNIIFSMGPKRLYLAVYSSPTIQYSIYFRAYHRLIGVPTETWKNMIEFTHRHVLRDGYPRSIDLLHE